MKDRVPLYPGRVKLTPVSGKENTYDMVRADEPTQEGTPLNKATLLKDATAALLGLESDAVPDDAFVEIDRQLSDRAQVVLLWENASPGSDFAAQTISLNTIGYHLILIIFVDKKSAITIKYDGNGIGIPLYEIHEFKYNNIVCKKRNMEIYDDRVVFSNCTYSHHDGYTNINGEMKPLMIFGIKGVTL